MPRYRNIAGALWRRPSGEGVPPGATFEATAREHERIQRRGYRSRLALVTDDAAPPVQVVGADEQPTSLAASAPLVIAAPASVALPSTWPLRMSPETYLKLHPTGPHAALARTLVGAGE